MCSSKYLDKEIYSVISFCFSINCMFFAGDSAATGKKFKTVVKKEVMITCSDFFEAASLMFASYYVFNLQYPYQALATMEFVHR